MLACLYFLQNHSLASNQVFVVVVVVVHCVMAIVTLPVLATLKTPDPLIALTGALATLAAYIWLGASLSTWLTCIGECTSL